MTYRPDIDGLRAMAVLSVVFCHAGLSCPGGYIGVDVFFVISGYLITRLMMKELEAGRFSLVDFWERRIRRILPALFVVLAVSFVAGWFLLVPQAYRDFGRSVVNVGLLQANIHFSHLLDYFSPAAEEFPLLHTWSLSVEEQFYLVMPLLFPLLVRRRPAWMVPIVVTAAVISLALGVYATETGDQRGYYLLPTRAWELLVGVLTAIGPGRHLSMPPRVREVASAIAIAGLFIPCFVYDRETPFPGLAALPPVIGTAAILALGAADDGPTRVHRLLSSRTAVRLGLISYSLYLWHWPLLVFYRYYAISPLTFMERIGLVVLAGVLATLSYRYVEQPLRGRRVLSQPIRFWSASAVTIGSILLSGLMFKQTGGGFNRLPLQARVFAQTGEIDRLFLQEKKARDVPNNLVTAGVESADPELLVWGDSHAMALLPAIDDLCRTAGLGARGAVHSGWAPMVEHLVPVSPRAYDEANAFNAAVLDYLRSSQIRDVILAACWRNYAGHPRFTEVLLQTVDELRHIGCRVYFMKDVPSFDYDVAAMVTRYAWQGRDPSTLALSVESYDARNRFHATVLSLLHARGVAVLDPIPVLQARTNSIAIVPYDHGGLFYRDSNHLSVYGATAIRSVFEPIIHALTAERIEATADGSSGSTRTRR